MATSPLCILFDNGSLRASSTLSLRRIAAGLEERLGRPVRPVSLLHSSAVDVEELEGQPAEILEPTVRRLAEAGQRDLLLLPLFFGPSGALTEYLPKRLAKCRAVYPDLRWVVAPPLVNVAEPADDRVARIVADQVLGAKREIGAKECAVVLVDHGSPQPAVTAVRNRVGEQVRHLLGGEANRFAVASMERRPGSEFDFNEPLLETLLGSHGFASGDLIVSLLFLSPGRHAGPGGDVERICRQAENRCPGLRIHRTGLVGSDPRLIEILADRARDALSSGAI